MTAPPRHRTAARWALALAVLFVLYQTFLPFRFAWSASQLAAGLARASWWPFGGGALLGWSDVIGNVLLFLPVGFFVALAGRGRRLLAALSAGLLLSAAVETLQLFSPLRYTQVSDVLVNTTGAGLGCLLATAGGAGLFTGAVGWTERRLREDPLAVAVAALSALVLLGAMLPLDLSISHSALRHQLARAHWNPLSLPAEPGRLAAALALIKQGWLMAFWGATAAAYLDGRRRALARILAGAALLVVVAEAGQVFVVSRTVSTIEPLVGWLGAAGGAALVLGGRRVGLGRNRLAWVLGFGYAVYLVSDSVAPLATTVLAGLRAGHLPAPANAGWRWAPSLWATTLSPVIILGEWAGRLLRFLPLGGWLYLAAGRPRRRLALAGLAGLIVLALEAVVGWIGPRPADAAEVLMAWAGIAAGWALAARLPLPGRVPALALDELDERDLSIPLHPPEETP